MSTYQTPDEWRTEFRALIDCKNAFMDGYSRSYHARNLSEFLQEMIQAHGRDRVRQVVATTIKNASWDGRYYREVKAWAAQVEPFPQFPGHHGDPRRFYYFCLEAHPVIVNDTACILMAHEKVLVRPKQREPER